MLNSPLENWGTVRLGELFQLDTDGCIPSLSPRESFLHYSIPAWDETGGPIIERGAAIESNKILLMKPCILVSKLNPRISPSRFSDPAWTVSRYCALDRVDGIRAARRLGLHGILRTLHAIGSIPATTGSVRYRHNEQPCQTETTRNFEMAGSNLGERSTTAYRPHSRRRRHRHRTHPRGHRQGPAAPYRHRAAVLPGRCRSSIGCGQSGCRTWRKAGVWRPVAVSSRESRRTGYRHELRQNRQVS